MHLAARRGLRCASKHPARFVAGRRHSASRFVTRPFHSSPSGKISFPNPFGSFFPKPSGQGQPPQGEQPPFQDEYPSQPVWNPEHNRWDVYPTAQAQFTTSAVPVEKENEGGPADIGEPAQGSNGNGGAGNEKDKNEYYGSALKRAMRNKKSKATPVSISLEFLSGNVRRFKYDRALTNGVLHLSGKGQAKSDSVATDPIGGRISGVSSIPSASGVSSSSEANHDTPSETWPGKHADFAVSSTGTQLPQDIGSQKTVNGGKSLDDERSQSTLEPVLVKLYASLQKCSLAYAQMEETYGPPGEALENWENLPDKKSEMPNVATEYERLATEFEEVAIEAFKAFPEGELARRMSAEPELGEEFAKHVNDLEAVLHDDPVDESVGSSSTANPSDPEPAKTSPEYFPQYALNEDLFAEVTAVIAAGLSYPRPGNTESFARKKSHLKLVCPIDGGTYFLDKVVEEAATELQADVTVLDPQDIAEMAAEYIREGSDPLVDSMWTLGYQVALARNDQPALEPNEEDMEGEEEAEDDRDNRPGFPAKMGAVTTIPLTAAPPELQNVIRKFLNGSGDSNFSSQQENFGGNSLPFNIHQVQAVKGSNAPNPDARLGLLLETLVDANLQKRSYLNVEKKRILRSLQSKCAEQGLAGESQSWSGSTSLSQIPAQDTPSIVPLSGVQQFPTEKSMAFAKHSRPKSPPTILLIRDFREMRSTPQGIRVTDKLIDIVSKRRQDGQQIMIVGTSSSASIAEHASVNALKGLQGEDAPSVFRTLVVTPETHRGLYYQEERRRIREINFRHLFALTKHIDPGSRSSDYQKKGYRHFSSELRQMLMATPFLAELEERVLSLDETHRIISIANGQRNRQIAAQGFDQELSISHVAQAISLIRTSDQAKWKWAAEEEQVQNPSKHSEHGDGRTAEARLKKLRKTCNAREKVLLRGVVNPENINTTFEDVHVNPETIEALQTLTTLSLTRPEAFKYGVLAKDKLSGLLLYGPPGTGKTLLAKAVAKQSGATVLEVSGSDVYDMYVGEGEKNVRAVFSLAKKLAPCVVFIDEADAIFASRGGSGSKRSSHRELINQFLREWDGMNETSAFIMVATNRPFDLDDAALRRLPRRLLIDLPSEQDREAILRIHLKDEQLDGAVALADLAAQTPLYSGSDLKNMAVAAALAAVREENDAAAAAAADPAHAATAPPPKHRFPERRTLHPRHFARAMEEISASVSEDMSSLGAIRKFDEQYGDRRGRRKKVSYGFASGGEAREETAKVRT